MDTSQNRPGSVGGVYPLVGPRVDDLPPEQAERTRAAFARMTEAERGRARDAAATAALGVDAADTRAAGERHYVVHRPERHGPAQVEVRTAAQLLAEFQAAATALAADPDRVGGPGPGGGLAPLGDRILWTLVEGRLECVSVQWLGCAPAEDGSTTCIGEVRAAGRLIDTWTASYATAREVRVNPEPDGCCPDTPSGPGGCCP